jgi:pimeloyl-ACP methyl ester carboxylesterase
MGRLAKGLLIVAALYTLGCWLILSALITPERKHGPVPSAAALGVTEIHAVDLRSANGGIRLQGWLVPSSGDRAVILVHGIHSYAWDCQAPDLVRAYADAGFSVLLFDLRANGRSDGDHLGLGLTERGDVQAASDLLLERGFRPGHIGIHGTSYGAAVALFAAAHIDAIGAVVADSAFADVRDVIGGELERQTGLPAGLSSTLLPGLRVLGLALYSLDLDLAVPERSIARIAPRPILLIHGARDSVIPHAHAKRLRAAAGSNAELWTLPGGHSQGLRLAPGCDKPAPTRDAFLAKVTGFFERNL